MLIAFVWLLILLFKASTALRLLRVAGREPARDLASVTVVQPILSGDPALESVLASNLQSLTGASFLWLIDEDDTQAARVTQRLQRQHPDSSIRIYAYPQAPEGVNPKLFKMEQGRALVNTSAIMVLDDDATLDAASLQEMLNGLDDNSLVTALPGTARRITRHRACWRSLSTTTRR